MKKQCIDGKMSCLCKMIPNRCSSDEEKARGEFPSWYESSDEVVPRANHDTASMGEHDMEMSEKARVIMKDRFGMTLPAQRTDNQDSDGDSRI